MKETLSARLKLYLILETAMLKMPLEDFIIAAIKGGVTAIQLRDKGVRPRERYETALKIKNMTEKFGVLFIINDSAELALAVEADGVHLGINDMPPEAVRRIMPNKIIGYSCNTVEDCHIAKDYADYAGIGPVFPTDTKKDLREVIGISGLKRNVELLQMPCVAIGGISADNAHKIYNCGVSGIAVSSYICAANDPFGNAAKLVTMQNERI